MEWKVITYARNFHGAQALLRTEGYLLALWNHEQCRGWQLYRFDHRGQTRWMAGAGAESLAGTDEQARRWAEEVIEQQPPAQNSP